MVERVTELELHARLRAEMATLKGKLRHYCDDWDQMPIDETCPEMQCCHCEFEAFESSEVEHIVAEAAKSWPSEKTA